MTIDGMPFVPSGNPIAEFRRYSGSKSLGCLVYVAITPFIALFFALIVAMPLAYGLKQMGLSEESAKKIFPILLVPIGLGTMAYAFREYRGRASSEVAIYRDGLTTRTGGVRRTLAFDEVEAVRLIPSGTDLACILVTKLGEKVGLPPDIAPCSVASRALETTVIRTLARRVGGRIDARETVEVIEDRTRSTLIIGRGLTMIVAGLLLVLTLRHARLGLGLIQHGGRLVSQGRDGLRGGFVVNAEGFQSPGADGHNTIRWDELKQIRADFGGMAFLDKDGRSLVASPFADGFWPVKAWVDSRIIRS